MNNKKLYFVLLLVLCILPGTAVAEAPRGSALGTAFTYQGELQSAGTPYSGTCDFKFGLYDSATGGTIVADTAASNTSVSEGIFTVQLDFGWNVFTGMDRWLSISVRCPAGGGTYQQLLPRQHLTGAPYALFSKTAPWDGIMDKPMGFDDNIDNDTVYTAGDGLTLVGTQFQGKGTPYHNMVIVARVGGDFTSIQAALEYIEDDASPENHCLVYIAPGVYNEQVTMKPFIDIEGAGELTTKITFTGSDNQYAGTVVGANDAELRFLTVENTGSSTYATAIFNNNTSPRLTYVTASASGGTYNDGVYNYNSSSPMMMNVTASASGGTYINIGVNNYNSSSPMMTNVTVSASEGTYNYGVANTNSSSPTMVNVTANGSGGTYAIGVYNEFSSSTMTNVTASASNGASNVGIYNVSSSGSHTVMVNNSHITGSNYTIYNDNEFDVFVGASQLSGGAVHLGGGTVKCIGVYDENYNSAGFTTCP